MRQLFISTLVIALNTVSPVSSSQAKGYDVITMNNGDIHNGTIDIEHFSIKTSFGDTVHIPYTHIADLKLTSQQLQDRLYTHSGDAFIGDIQQQEMTLVRTLDPLLPVNPDDIAHIRFSRKNSSRSDKARTVIINSRYGDIFSVNYLPKSVNIKTPGKTISVPGKTIASIDFDWLVDEEKLSALIRTKDNSVFQGELALETIKVETAYHQALVINPAEISFISFGIENNKRYKQLPVKLGWQMKLYTRDLLSDKTPGPELVKLKAASFMRGDNAGDSDERPAMNVNLKAFAISSHEITFSQFDKFCDDTRKNRSDDQEWGRESRPVVNVSWNDAVAYTHWLSQKTGHTYRLPTDAEWEYAARAGSTSSFWWGEQIGSAMANCEGCESIWSGEKTAPVGRFPANAFGLYDTAGNVFEWVADCYHNTFEHAPADGSAIDKPGCGKRVIRGGAWSFPAKEIRSANRWRDFPTRKSDDTGFRVVRELN